MKRFLLVWALLIQLILAAGCDAQPPPASASVTATDPALPQRAQPRLPTVKLWLGTNEITAEIARSLRQIQTGMMFRTGLGEMEGMLFVFPAPERRAFWMKNVSLALSCAYIDPDGTILEVHSMRPQEERSIVSSSRRIQYVLEMPEGWFDRHHVKTGMVVRTEAGSLAESFGPARVRE